MEAQRHAYLILAHKNLRQLKKLLSLLDDDRNDIFVHLDSKAPFGYEQLEGCCARAGLEFIRPQIRVSWGGASIVRAEMALLQAATREQHRYYHLLSGLDLPLKSQDEIHSFFDGEAGASGGTVAATEGGHAQAGTVAVTEGGHAQAGTVAATEGGHAQAGGREFIDMWKLQDHTRKRVELYTPFPEGNHFFLTNWLNHMFKAVFRIRVNAGVDFHIGSQWFSITDGFARFICSRADWVAETFRHTGLCDEIFIPTLLMMSPYKDKLFLNSVSDNHQITTANMRYIDWKGSGSVRHPKTLGMEDLPALLAAPQFWARKFDESVSPEVIDAIFLHLTK